MNTDDPKWRSPLTRSTYAHIVHLRKLHRQRVAHVNAALLIIYRERQALLDAALLKEEQDNA